MASKLAQTTGWVNRRTGEFIQCPEDPAAREAAEYWMDAMEDAGNRDWRPIPGTPEAPATLADIPEDFETLPF